MRLHRFIPTDSAACAVRALLGVLMLGHIVLALGCGPTQSTLVAENDKLRRANLKLQNEVDDLNRRIAGRLAQLQAAQSQTSSHVTGMPGAQVPVATSITFGQFSGPSDTDRDGVDDAVRLYLVTQDQRGRFLPVAGVATLQVVVLQADRAPVVLQEQVYDPAKLESAFRSGFAGTHYTLEVPLDASQVPQGQPLTVQVTLTDAATGAKFTHQQAYPVRRLSE